MVPWGYKLTIYICIEGEKLNSNTAIRAAQEASKVLKEAGFVYFAGARIDEVHTKPIEQVALSGGSSGN